MSARSPRRTPRRKPVLAFTCGEPAGIGPELVVAALPRVRAFCEAVLVGERSVWRRAGWRPGSAPLVDTRLGLEPPPFGRESAEGGKISFGAVRTAARLAARRLVDGIVTAPVSKRSWNLAGAGFSDHTEFFRAETGVAAEMILAAPGENLWCVTATRHVPLARVPRLLSSRRVAAAARSLRTALRRVGKARPRIGLCALNPHAGEGGLIGGEERLLEKAARAAGINGPIAADTAWRWHREGRLDGLVCLYHDQALIPLKTAAGLGIVNWTVGLPYVRTSPGHGTGLDIAGRRRADPSALIAAAKLAARLS